MLYKVIHHLVDINADTLLPPHPCNHSTHGHPNKFLQLLARVNAYANFPKQYQDVELFTVRLHNIFNLN